MFEGEEAGRFVWWDLEDVEMQRMLATIQRVGAENLRLEFHPVHADGPRRLIVVDKRTGEPCGSYNVSQTCPPNCP